jgi:purine nucleosidase
MTEKLLLDTDIGSDIDDAVCLAYLLSQPRCDLLGITTVTGDVEQRARLASVLCKLAGKAIPIFPGASQCMLVPQRQPEVPQAAALSHWPHETDFPRGQAIEFMRHTILSNPGEVTLLGIGPLTNIALLFLVDPEIPHLLKQLVLMCGRFTGINAAAPQVEWNALVDPHATAIVYKAPVPEHRSVGLDVTLKVRMPVDEVRQRFESRLLEPVLDFAEVWFKDVKEIIFHDPLAGATIFDSSICEFQSGEVEIDLENVPGQTLWKPGSTPASHKVASKVDLQEFFTHFFSVFE